LDGHGGRRLVVLGGGKVGLSTAMFAASRGAEVTVLEPSSVFAPELGLPGRFRMVHEAGVAGVTLVPNVVVSEVTPDGVRYDSAFVYAYVVSGQMASQVESQPEHIYRAGECWYETPGAHHLISRNASNTEPAKPLAVLVAVTGDNAMTTHDHAGGSR